MSWNYRNMTLSHKIIGVCFIFMVPVGILMFLTVWAYRKDIVFAEAEIKGLRYLEALRGVLESTIDQQLNQGRAEAVKKALENLHQVDQELGVDLEFTPDGLKQRGRERFTVATLESDARAINGAKDVVAAAPLFTQMTADILGMMLHAGDTSKLILDPDLDSFYLMDLVLLAIPQHQERLRSMLLEGQDPYIATVIFKTIDIDRISNDTTTAIAEDGNFYGKNARLQTGLAPALKEYQDAVNMLLQQPKNPNTVLRKTFTLWDASRTILQDLLETRHNEYVFKQMTAVTISFLTLILLGLLGWGLASSTLRLLGADPSEISSVIKTLATGDTDLPLKETITYGVYNDIRDMVKGLNDKANQAEAIAAGDLTKKIALLSDRDRLGKSFQTMTTVLQEVITRANLAANQVAAGSGQVSSASQSLSQGATEQAAAVEEITSSVTEISSKIKHNADSAANACETAQRAQKSAAQGSQQIEVTLTAMKGINQSSREISKIIKVIDDIAFQTNLLALNAAVEAARAGRHGKGFAVVAEEVRNLAGRSAKAARETTELIESSSRKVEDGLNEALKTSESFKEIVDGSLEVASTVKLIAEAGREQAAAIAQIASGVSQINKVTLTTTASAEETASAAEELSGQSQELKRSLAYFQIGDDGSGLARSSQSLHQGRVIAFKGVSPAETSPYENMEQLSKAHF